MEIYENVQDGAFEAELAKLIERHASRAARPGRPEAGSVSRL